MGINIKRKERLNDMQTNSAFRNNFFQRFFASFSSPDFYIQAIREPLSKAIRYTLMLAAILSILGGIYLSLQVKQTFSYMNAFISDSHFPDLAIADGRLQLTAENDMELTIGKDRDFIAIIDSGEQKNYTHLSGYAYGVFMNSDYIALKRLNAAPMVIKFEQVGNFRLPKASLQDILKTSEIVSYVFTFLFYYIRMLSQYFFKAMIVYAILALTFPLLRVNELKLKGSQVFSIILYSMSFATIASEAFNFINPNQWIVSLLIILFYMITLKIARTGIVAILLDKVGDKFHNQDQYL